MYRLSRIHWWLFWQMKPVWIRSIYPMTSSITYIVASFVLLLRLSKGSLFDVIGQQHGRSTVNAGCSIKPHFERTKEGKMWRGLIVLANILLNIYASLMHIFVLSVNIFQNEEWSQTWTLGTLLITSSLLLSTFGNVSIQSSYQSPHSDIAVKPVKNSAVRLQFQNVQCKPLDVLLYHH